MVKSKNKFIKILLQEFSKKGTYLRKILFIF